MFILPIPLITKTLSRIPSNINICFFIPAWQLWGFYRRGACDPRASEEGSGPVWRGPCRSPAAPAWWGPSAAAAAECGYRRTPGVQAQMSNCHRRVLWGKGDTHELQSVTVKLWWPVLTCEVASYLASLLCQKCGIVCFSLSAKRSLRNIVVLKNVLIFSIPVWCGGCSRCSCVRCWSCCCCCLLASFFI